LTVTV
jgi:hypothetical protein